MRSSLLGKNSSALTKALFPAAFVVQQPASLTVRVSVARDITVTHIGGAITKRFNDTHAADKKTVGTSTEMISSGWYAQDRTPGTGTDTNEQRIEFQVSLPILSRDRIYVDYDCEVASNYSSIVPDYHHVSVSKFEDDHTHKAHYLYSHCCEGRYSHVDNAG